jgi:hypothetical protein
LRTYDKREFKLKRIREAFEITASKPAREPERR